MDHARDAAVVEAEKHALGNEESLDLLAVLVAWDGSTERSFGGVTEDTGDDDGRELGHAAEAVADGTDAEEGREPGTDHEEHGEDGQEQVEDGVEGEKGRPLGVHKRN